MHDRLKAPSVHDRLSDRREAQEDHDVVSRRRRHDNDGLAEATSHTKVAVTTAGRTAVLPLGRLALEFSVRPSAAPASQPGFVSQQISQSTAVRPTLNFGWPITA